VVQLVTSLPQTKKSPSRETRALLYWGVELSINASWIRGFWPCCHCYYIHDPVVTCYSKDVEDLTDSCAGAPEAFQWPYEDAYP